MKKYIVSQFGHPHGWVGRLAGSIMARNNRERNEWVVSLLDVQPGDRILEIGFGPGVAIEKISHLVTTGFVTGIDASEIMVRQARKRNARALQNGHLELQHGSVASLPYNNENFDKIFAVNSLHHWPDPAKNLKEVWRVLKTGGMLAITEQPRFGSTNEDVIKQKVGGKLSGMLEHAGFSQIKLECKHTKPRASICVLAYKNESATQN